MVAPVLTAVPSPWTGGDFPSGVCCAKDEGRKQVDGERVEMRESEKMEWEGWREECWAGFCD